jgi:transposase
VRQKKLQAADVFVSLSYRPGELSEVDFFDVVVDERGQRHAWKFLMHLIYSGYDFVWLYDRCDQLAFLDAHVWAFAYFGGVPQRIAYDNLTPAVRKIVGAERVLTERFAALATYYLFEPCFARPGEGHDKGGIESRGKAIRLRSNAMIVTHGKKRRVDAGNPGAATLAGGEVAIEGHERSGHAFDKALVAHQQRERGRRGTVTYAI